MDYKKFKEIINKLIRAGMYCLPSAMENSNPDLRLAGMIGAILHTFEWFSLKISFLEPDDLDGIIEWQEYIIKKTKEKFGEDIFKEACVNGKQNNCAV